MNICKRLFCSKVNKFDLSEAFRKYDMIQKEHREEYADKKSVTYKGENNKESLDFIIKNKKSSSGIKVEEFDPTGYNKRKKLYKIQGAEENKFSNRRETRGVNDKAKFFDFRVSEGLKENLHKNKENEKSIEETENVLDIDKVSLLNTNINITSEETNHTSTNNKSNKKVKTKDVNSAFTSDIELIETDYSFNSYVNYEYIFDLETISFIIANKSRTIHEVFIDSDNHSQIKSMIINYANKNNIKTTFLPYEKLLRYSYNLPQHSGLILKVDKISFKELKENKLSKDLLSESIITVFDQINDKYFISSFIRTLSFYGLRSTIWSSSCLPSITSLTSKFSTGATESIDFYNCKDIHSFLEDSINNGYIILTPYSSNYYHNNEKENLHSSTCEKDIYLDELSKIDKLNKGKVVLFLPGVNQEKYNMLISHYIKLRKSAAFPLSLDTLTGIVINHITNNI